MNEHRRIRILAKGLDEEVHVIRHEAVRKHRKVADVCALQNLLAHDTDDHRINEAASALCGAKR